MKSGRTIRSRIASTPRAISIPKKSEVESKPKAPKPAARKRTKHANSESESAVSSDADKNQPESEEEVENKSEERPVQRQTRGLKQDLKGAFDSSDDETESSFDGYDEIAEQNENGDDDMSDIEDTPVAQSLAKNSGTVRRFRRSGSPPTTPGRFVRSEQPSISPLTPPSTLKSIVETTNIGGTSEMSYDQKIKQELSVFKNGMMLPLSHPPSSPNISRKISAGNSPYVEESAIFQSIECDEEEERGYFEPADEEMGEGGEDDREDAEYVVRKGAIGPPLVPDNKKSMSYFQWMRTAVNRA
jgi:hypothetical protein